jgi:flavin reductase (DIM6/NTAB) family NADH-FMN oxidoreductase RutF
MHYATLAPLMLRLRTKHTAGNRVRLRFSFANTNMSDCQASAAKAAVPEIRVIRPSILYFGTPVVLIGTVNPDGRPNLSPMSSAWALDDRVVLGMGLSGQGCQNLMRTGEAVINLPGPALHQAVEAIAATTACKDVPPYKSAMGYRYEADKFSLAGLTAVPADLVAAPRVAQCALQLEARLLATHRGTNVGETESGFVSLEMQVIRVHAHADMLCEGSDHVDTSKWSPLLYVFRHYFGTGERLGRNFRAER